MYGRTILDSGEQDAPDEYFDDRDARGGRSRRRAQRSLGRRLAGMALGAAVVAVLAGLGFAGYWWLNRGPDVTTADVAAVEEGSLRDSLTEEPGAGPPISVASSSVDNDPNLLWVDPENGDDANDGQTSASAWASFQAALDRVEPGQTVHLMSGRYTHPPHDGFVHFLATRGGTEEQWIRIAAAPGESPVIVATEAGAIGVQAPYIEIDGLTIVGEGFGPDNPYGWGVHVGQTHHVRVKGLTISDMPVGGITTVDSSNIEILYNEVFGNSFWGTEQGSGISIWHARDLGFGPAVDGYHDVIIGNVVYGNENKVFSRWAPGEDIITDGNGIIIDENDDTGYTGRILVANNILFDNGGRGVLVNESSRVDVIHNTSFHNARTADLAGGKAELAMARSDDVHFLNNLAWHRDGAGAITFTDATNAVMGGNVFITDKRPEAATELDLVTGENPGLRSPTLDPSAADFRPEPSSLLAGRAVPTSPHVPFDADFGARPVSGGTVGAYESGS